MTSDVVKQLCIDPQNVGDVSGTASVGRAGSLKCGAVLRFSLAIDENQRITEARFRSAGCSYLVAASSLLTTQVKGKSTGEAALIAQDPKHSIIGMLGDSPDRLHCALLACEALISAVKTYSDAVREEWSGDEALICTCFGVSERTIEREIRTGELRTIEEVTRTCNAGAGCQSCYPLIEEILSQYWRERDLLLHVPR